MRKKILWLFLILTIFFQFVTTTPAQAANEEYFIVNTMEAAPGEPIQIRYYFRAIQGENYTLYLKNTNGTVYQSWNLTCQPNGPYIAGNQQFTAPSDIGQYEFQLYGRLTEEIHALIWANSIFQDIGFFLLKASDHTFTTWGALELQDYLIGKLGSVMVQGLEFLGMDFEEEEQQAMFFKSPPMEIEEYSSRVWATISTRPGGQINASYENIPNKNNSSIGLYSLGVSDEYWTEIQSTGTNTTGNVWFDMPMIPGSYQLRSVYLTHGAYVRTGVSSPFYVIPHHSVFRNIPEKTNPGGQLNIEIANAPYGSHTWAGIYPLNSMRYDTYWGNLISLNGTNSGVINGTAPITPGVYCVRVFSQGSDTITISTSPPFEVSDALVLPGDQGNLGNVGNVGNLDPYVITTEKPADMTRAIVLQAQAGAESVQLAWNSITDARGVSGYYIYRATTSGGQTQLALTDFPLNEIAYTDTNVIPGMTYYYIVKPVYNDNTIGPESNEVSAAPQEPAGTIQMTIGNPLMIANGVSKEIDPGRGTTPVLFQGRTFLPIKAVIAEMGGTVSWDGTEQKVTIQWNGKTLELWIGRTVMKLNGIEQTLDVAPYLSVTGRTMLPLRFVGAGLGCQFTWEGSSQTVTISYALTNAPHTPPANMPNNNTPVTTEPQTTGLEATGPQSGSTPETTITTPEITTTLDASNQQQGTATWTGVWNTEYGMLTLAQSGNNVSGTFGEWNYNYQLNGVVNGNKLAGTIDYYGEPSSFELTLSGDGGLRGWYRPDNYEDWEDSLEWMGVKVAGSFGTTSTSWGGTWYTDFGPMVLNQNGLNVSGVYRVYTDTPVFQIEGTVSGNTFTGRVREEEFEGVFEFNLESDGKSFTGQYCYTGEDVWTNWKGVKKK